MDEKNDTLASHQQNYVNNLVKSTKEFLNSVSDIPYYSSTYVRNLKQFRKIADTQKLYLAGSGKFLMVVSVIDDNTLNALVFSEDEETKSLLWKKQSEGIHLNSCSNDL